MWEGHLDTVQVTGMDDPFTPRIEGGRLYGRGAVDDKGCVTAFMLAMRELAKNPPPGDVTFLAAMDEEYHFRGIAHHLERGERYDLGIAGEPTNLRIVRACKGCVRWYVEVLGRPAHTAKPHEGVNAITVARHVLTAFEEAMTRRLEEHLLLGRSTLTCTAFEAGEGPNTVPSRAMLRFDYRCLPGEDSGMIWRDFAALATSIAEETPGIRCVVHEPFIDFLGHGRARGCSHRGHHGRRLSRCRHRSDTDRRTLWLGRDEDDECGPRANRRLRARFDRPGAFAERVRGDRGGRQGRPHAGRDGEAGRAVVSAHDPGSTDLYQPETEADLIAAFRRNPRGPYSPVLQRLLNIVHADLSATRVVLVTLEPFKRWAIASVPEERGERIEIEHDTIFTDLAEAEWALFRRRWLLRTGVLLDP